MFRNQSDRDVTVWILEGRLHKVDDAEEAVKLSSATVGLKNRTHAVLTALKRASSKLSAHEKTIIRIDAHIGITFAGVTADARILSGFMKTECLDHKHAHTTSLPVSLLMAMVGNEMQARSKRYRHRPYGVGLLVAGCDDQGPHVYQSWPSSYYSECKAMAIGSGSKSACTYLKEHLQEFLDCATDELIKHGLRALRDTLPDEVELNAKNVSIGIVGINTPFNVVVEEVTAQYLRMIEGEERRGGQPDTRGHSCAA